jgi:hypothetical protein
MLTSRYLASIKNLPAIMGKVAAGTAPDKFNVDHLKGLGFKSSTDRAVLPLLKDLGFLTEDGTPTKRYHDYRDKSRAKAVMAEALREAYQDLFHINEKLSESDRDAILGKFKSTHNVTDRVAELQAMTFFALLKLADLDAVGSRAPAAPPSPITQTEQPSPPGRLAEAIMPGLRYNIEIHLPPTKDVEVYNAIFKSLREHLLD